MVSSPQNNVAYPWENSVAATKTPDIRSQSSSPRTRIRGVRGIARHMRARQGRWARLTVRVENAPKQLSSSAEARVPMPCHTVAVVGRAPNPCVDGTVSKVNKPAAKLDHRVCTAPGHSVRGCVEGGRTDVKICLLYTSPSPRDRTRSRMPSSA